MKKMKKHLFIALAGIFLITACEEETVNSVVTFNQMSTEITTDDLSPVDVTIDIEPSAPSNSTIALIVTGSTYGETFTTSPALTTGQINIPVTSGANSATFSIIPDEDGIRFDDIELEFEIISVGSGLQLNDFDGRFFTLTITNNREQGTGLPFAEDFDLCGPSGSGNLPPTGWEEVIVAQNSLSTAGFACYTGQNTTAIQANAFSPNGTAGNDYSEVWMITPLIGLVDANNPTLSFDVDRRFDSPIDANTLAYGIQISTDYDGTNFETANWQVFEAGVSAMTANDPNADDIGNTGDLDLSAFAGETIHIAFIYRASDAQFGATILRIGNVVVQ